MSGLKGRVMKVVFCRGKPKGQVRKVEFIVWPREEVGVKGAHRPDEEGVATVFCLINSIDFVSLK